MAQSIYQMWMAKYTPAWWDLTKEEQDAQEAKAADALKQVGGETVVVCISLWASEEWIAWGVEKYPDVEALQKHSELLYNIGHYKYHEARSCLGVQM